MDARARFAAGGFIAGAAVIAVVSAVAMSNTTALADVPGASAGLPGVRVAAATASPSASASANGTASALPAPVPTTETVPAPEPAVVAPPAATQPEAAPVVQAPTATDEDTFVADAQRNGSWANARKWALDHGWSQERIDRWLAVLDSKLAQARQTSAGKSAAQTPAHAGTTSGRVLKQHSGLKRDRSHVPPDGD